MLVISYLFNPNLSKLLQIKYVFIYFFSFQLFQLRPSISSVDTAKLNEQIMLERERCEDLTSRLGKSINELSEATSRENEMRTSLSKKDKDLALAKHELKEAQRRADQEMDARKKADR